MNRAQALNLIYRLKHQDFKAKIHGKRTITNYVPGAGTTLITIDDLTDSEIRERLPAHFRKDFNPEDTAK